MRNLTTAGFTALSDGTVRKKLGYFFLSASTGVVAAKESCEEEEEEGETKHRLVKTCFHNCWITPKKMDLLDVSAPALVCSFFCFFLVFF